MPTISLTERSADVDNDIRRYVKQSLLDLRDSFDSSTVDWVWVEGTVVTKAKGE
jgi:hypothetical protein